MSAVAFGKIGVAVVEGEVADLVDHEQAALHRGNGPAIASNPAPPRSRRNCAAVTTSVIRSTVRHGGCTSRQFDGLKQPPCRTQRVRKPRVSPAAPVEAITRTGSSSRSGESQEQALRWMADRVASNGAATGISIASEWTMSAPDPFGDVALERAIGKARFSRSLRESSGTASQTPPTRGSSWWRRRRQR